MNMSIRNFNFSTSKNNTPNRAQKLYGKNRDYGYYYDNLSLYCADNDINLSLTTDKDFDNHVRVISDFGNNTIDKFYFWID